jgi:hypothetical protein
MEGGTRAAIEKLADQWVAVPQARRIIEDAFALCTELLLRDLKEPGSVADPVATDS